MREVIRDLTTLMTMSAEACPGLSDYLSGVISLIKKAPAVLVENPSDLLAEIGKRLPADSAECFGANPLGVALPFPSVWLELSDRHGNARGLLLRSAAPDMIHARLAVRALEPVALAHYTGSHEHVGRWIPTDCEYMLSLDGPAGAKEGVIRKLCGGSKTVPSLIAACGDSGIIPIPAHDRVSHHSQVESLEAFKPTLREAYLALAALKSGAFRLVEVDQGPGASVYDLRPAPLSEIDRPEARRMIWETIKSLPGCTLCGGTPIATGGVLTRPGRTGGCVYAICSACMGRPDRFRLVEQALFGKGSRQMPAVEGPGKLQ